MRIYVAGPYSADTEEGRLANTNAAIAVGLELRQKGHWPYIPHLTHWVDVVAVERGQSLTWEDWMEWDDQWLKQCDALFFISPSPGANVELERATSRGLAVYRSLEEVPVETKQS